MDSEEPKLTTLVNRWNRNKDDRAAGNALFDVIDRELRKISQKQLKSIGGPPTLRATEIANEVYLRLREQNIEKWGDRKHFFAVASTLISRTIIDAMRYERAKRRDWRAEVQANADQGHLEIPSNAIGPETLVQVADQLHNLETALDALHEHSPVSHNVVVQRVFDEKTLRAISAELGISEDAAQRKWAYGKAFLAAHLSNQNKSMASDIA